MLRLKEDERIRSGADKLNMLFDSFDKRVTATVDEGTEVIRIFDQEGNLVRCAGESEVGFLLDMIDEFISDALEKD